LQPRAKVELEIVHQYGMTVRSDRKSVLRRPRLCEDFWLTVAFWVNIVNWNDHAATHTIILFWKKYNPARRMRLVGDLPVCINFKHWNMYTVGLSLQTALPYKLPECSIDYSSPCNVRQTSCGIIRIV